MQGVLSRLVAPSETLISLPEARMQCRLTSSEEDALLQGYIDAATAYLDARDGILGQVLVSQTWRLTLPSSPIGDLQLPLGPVASIVQAQYVDPAGAVQTLAGTNYRLSPGGVVELTSTGSWPATDVRAAAFWVDFVAGYGAASEVPASIRHIVRLMIAHWYSSREAVVIDSIASAIPMAAETLIAAARSERGLF